LLSSVLEVSSVDCLEARLLNKEAQKSTAGGDDDSRHLRPDIALG
jgi:hypothetical protein